MRTRLKSLTPLFPIALFFSLWGCYSDHEAGHGALQIELTDAPFPTDVVAEANVTISKIDIRRSSADDTAAFLTLSEEEISVNLLNLTNGVTASLVDLDIPEGTYNLVRLYVSEASVVLSDGTTHDLQVPSGAQTGIKVFVQPAIEVVGGLTAELLLDFDVCSSFVPKGNAKSPEGITGFNFKPVIKATNKSVAGRLVGAVLDSMEAPLANAQVSVFAADTLNTTTFTDESGHYEVSGLLAGMYAVTAESGAYAPVTEENVEISAANATMLDFQLLE